MAVWETEESIMLERWAIRLRTITPMRHGNAVLLVEKFYLAGGDEDLFTQMEKVSIEKGHDLARLIGIVLDCGFLSYRVRAADIQRFLFKVNTGLIISPN